MKNNNGITLVSLVVTIIILIILAGVSINLTLGENGIITIAKQAKENIELAKIEEETTLNELYTQIEIGGTEDFSYDALVKIQELQNQIDSLNATLSQTTATADKILKDYKAYSNGKLLTGTMANNGAVTKSLNAGESYTIAAGYHNGSGKVTANSLASQTQATATADDIANGKTAWVNGEQIIGTNNSNSKKYLLEDGVVKNGFSYTGSVTKVTEFENGLVVNGTFEFTIDVTNIKYIYCVLGAHTDNKTPYYPNIYVNNAQTYGDPSCINVSNLSGNATIKISPWGGNADTFIIFEIYTK